MALGVGVEEIRKEDRAEEKAYDWLPVKEGLFRRPVVTESGKETLDALGLEGGWKCLMDGGRLDTGVAKGSLSKELAVVGRVAVVSAVLGRIARPSLVFGRGVGVGVPSSVGSAM
jgi:hypothetical protein